MSEKPRLLILITLAEDGGAQTSVSLLLPGLTGEFDVTVAAHGSGPLRDAAQAAGIPFIDLEHMRRAIRPWQDALALLELVRLCRRLRPDIVHAHSSKAGALGRLAAALACVPVRIFTVHGWSFAAYSGLSGHLYLWVERRLRRVTNAVVCVAAASRDAGVAAGACRAERTVVIHNAVDVAAFASPPRVDGAARVVSIGRLAFPKDFGTLVEALAATRADYRAAFVGDGPLLQEVAARPRRALAPGAGALRLRDRQRRRARGQRRSWTRRIGKGSSVGRRVTGPRAPDTPRRELARPRKVVSPITSKRSAMPAASGKPELLELAAERSSLKPAASWNPTGRPRSCAGGGALLRGAGRCGVADAEAPGL